MILVKTYIKDNKINRVSISGHANYKDYGNDIVCASVSSISICTVNAIYSFNDDVEVVTKDGYMDIRLVGDNDINYKLIDNMIRCLKDIEKDYPNNLKIK